MSFTIKALRATITLRNGTFPDTNSNTVIIQNHHIKATISKPGGEDKNTLTASIYGLPLNIMESASTLAFHPQQSEKNLIKLEAGDDTGTVGTVFEGEFTLAYANFNGSPEISFEIKAAAGIYPALLATPPIAIQGTTDAAKLFEQFAAECGYTFINDGVSASVRNTTLTGSPIEKMHKLANQLGIDLYIDDSKVIITPAGSPRSGNAVLIKLGTGLIGYPSFTQDGIEFKCEFNPSITLGGLVRLESVVPRATGTWRVTGLTHTLECLNPQAAGSWESRVKATFIQE